MRNIILNVFLLISMVIYSQNYYHQTTQITISKHQNTLYNYSDSFYAGIYKHNISPVGSVQPKYTNNFMNINTCYYNKDNNWYFLNVENTQYNDNDQYSNRNKVRGWIDDPEDPYMTPVGEFPISLLLIIMFCYVFCKKQINIKKNKINYNGCL